MASYRVAVAVERLWVEIDDVVDRVRLETERVVDADDEATARDRAVADLQSDPRFVLALRNPPGVEPVFFTGRVEHAAPGVTHRAGFVFLPSDDDV